MFRSRKARIRYLENQLRIVTSERNTYVRMWVELMADRSRESG